MTTFAVWVTGDRGSHIRWEMVEHGSLRSWMVKRSEELLFTEKWDRAEWGRLYFTAESVSLYFMVLMKYLVYVLTYS